MTDLPSSLKYFRAAGKFKVYADTLELAEVLSAEVLSRLIGSRPAMVNLEHDAVQTISGEILGHEWNVEWEMRS